MRSSFPILQPMLINNTFNLTGAPTIRTQRCEILDPSVKEDGSVERTQLCCYYACDSGEGVGEGVEVG